MKTRIKEVNDLHRVIDIEVPPQQINKELKQIYQQLGKRAKLPGFRAGRVPEDLLGKYYKEEVEDELLRRLIPETTQKFIREGNLSPLTLPEVSNVQLEKDRLKFRISFDIRPQINLKRYKGIKTKSKNIKVTTEDIQKVLHKLQDDNAQMVNVEEEKVKEGDYIICDFRCSINGKIIEKKEKTWLHISDNLKLPELKKSLLGTKREDEINIEATLGKEVYGREFEGKRANFRIKIHEIKYKKLSIINDEFAKSLGPFSNLSELKEKIKEELDKNNKISIKHDTQSQIISFLLNSCSFPLSNSLVNAEKEAMVQSIQRRLSHQGYNDTETKEQVNKLEETVSEEAKNKVKLWFILDYIAEQEGIKISQGEIDDQIQSIAAQTKQTPEDLRKRIKSERLEERICLELKQTKVLEFLLNEADIVET